MHVDCVASVPIFRSCPRHPLRPLLIRFYTPRNRRRRIYQLSSSTFLMEFGVEVRSLLMSFHFSLHLQRCSRLKERSPKCMPLGYSIDGKVHMLLVTSSNNADENSKRIMEGSSDCSHILNGTSKEKALWSDIPPELFTLFLERLSFTDVLNCKPVCVSWHKMDTAHTMYLSLKLEDPLLIVPDRSLLSFVTGEGREDLRYSGPGYKCLYSFAKEFVAFAKVAAGKPCLGSLQGWLIFEDENNLYAFHP